VHEYDWQGWEKFYVSWVEGLTRGSRPANWWYISTSGTMGWRSNSKESLSMTRPFTQLGNFEVCVKLFSGQDEVRTPNLLHLSWDFLHSGFMLQQLSHLADWKSTSYYTTPKIDHNFFTTLSHWWFCLLRACPRRLYLIFKDSSETPSTRSKVQKWMT